MNIPVLVPHVAQEVVDIDHAIAIDVIFTEERLHLLDLGVRDLAHVGEHVHHELIVVDGAVAHPIVIVDLLDEACTQWLRRKQRDALLHLDGRDELDDLPQAEGEAEHRQQHVEAVEGARGVAHRHHAVADGRARDRRPIETVEWGAAFDLPVPNRTDGQKEDERRQVSHKAPSHALYHLPPRLPYLMK